MRRNECKDDKQIVGEPCRGMHIQLSNNHAKYLDRSLSHGSSSIDSYMYMYFLIGKLLGSIDVDFRCIRVVQRVTASA